MPLVGGVWRVCFDGACLAAVWSSRWDEQPCVFWWFLWREYIWKLKIANVKKSLYWRITFYLTVQLISPSVCIFLLLHSNSVVPDSQSTFTLTSSPEATNGQLCPERVTITCTTNNVDNLGTAIRWFFNNSTKLFEFVYFMGQTYPHTVENGTFVVVVASAVLVPAGVNAVINLMVDSSVLVDMGVYKISCGRELDGVIRSFNISEIDMQCKWLK